MMHPTKYASMLASKMERHGTTAWLVNTGWIGGRFDHVSILVCVYMCRYTISYIFFVCLPSYGVGNRIKLAYTRKIIDSIHDGSLLSAKYTKTPIFGLHIPNEVEGVPSNILHPENMVSLILSLNSYKIKDEELLKNQVLVNIKRVIDA